MGLFRAYLRHVGSGLKPYTKDDARRDFQKRQWRKRVDAQMAAARKGPASILRVCAGASPQGLRPSHRVQPEDDARPASRFRSEDRGGDGPPDAPAPADQGGSASAHEAESGCFVGFLARNAGQPEAGLVELPCRLVVNGDMLVFDAGPGSEIRVLARLEVFHDALLQAEQEGTKRS